jgi:hypothetical protein
MFMWPCIIKLGKVKNQPDATHMKFIQCSLAQHVSGIIMPIIKSTIQWTTAFDVQHWYCRLGPSEAGLLAVCTVWKLFFDFHTVHTASIPALLNPRRQYQCWTSNAAVRYIVLLMMGILMPETCWAKEHWMNFICVASSWLFTLPTCVWLLWNKDSDVGSLIGPHFIH